MQLLEALRRIHRRIGTCLALLLLCALNLGALQHYQPRMLQAAEFCTLGAEDESASQTPGKSAHAESACGLCCAALQFVSNAERETAFGETQETAAPRLPVAAPRSRLRANLAHRPRAPPRAAPRERTTA